MSDRRAEIERATTSIGDRVHIGAGAIVLMGCEIGDHCVVAAGAVFPQFTVAPDWSAASSACLPEWFPSVRAGWSTT